MDTALAPWSNFYVIVGSSAAALTGLVFIVITLVAGMDRLRSSSEGVAAFTTPTIVHFCVGLVVAAIVSAPWHALHAPATLLILLGVFGITYIARVAILASRQEAYRPVLEDWIWYTILPLACYAGIIATGALLTSHATTILFVLAAAVVGLVLIAIHNAWDIVTYLALRQFEGTPSDRATAQQDNVTLQVGITRDTES